MIEINTIVGVNLAQDMLVYIKVAFDTESPIVKEASPILCNTPELYLFPSQFSIWSVVYFV